MRAKFGVLEQAEFHLNVFIVSASGGQKPQFWANFHIFGGSCTDPLSPSVPNMVCYSRAMVYAYVPNFVSGGLFCHPLAAKNANFCHFWTSAFSGVVNWQQCEKVENGCATTNLPYPTASKSFLYSNVFIAKSGAQSLTFKSVTNRQTNRQTDKQKNSTFLAAPAACEIRAPPNLAW